jgi:hypothetical protein
MSSSPDRIHQSLVTRSILKARLSPSSPEVPVAAAIRRERPCLKCQTLFSSEGSGERICKKCKTQSFWREGSRASNVSSR